MDQLFCSHGFWFHAALALDGPCLLWGVSVKRSPYPACAQMPARAQMPTHAQTPSRSSMGPDSLSMKQALGQSDTTVSPRLRVERQN